MEYWTWDWKAIVGDVIIPIVAIAITILIYREKTKKEIKKIYVQQFKNIDNTINAINLRVSELETKETGTKELLNQILQKLEGLGCLEHRTRVNMVEEKLKGMSEYYLINHNKLIDGMNILSDKIDRSNESMNKNFIDLTREIVTITKNRYTDNLENGK